MDRNRNENQLNQAGGTKVYLLDLNFLQDPAVYEEMRGQVSLGRRLRADKYRFQEDRIRSLGAGLLLQAVTGLSDEDMDYEPGGKPFFPVHPEIAFSLSHSGMLAALAVSGRKCGVDCEEIRAEKESFRLIAQKYFTEEEQREVYGGSVASEEQREVYGSPAEEARERKEDAPDHVFNAEAFARIWTKKEAYVKMTGEGIAALKTTAEEPCFFPEVPAPEGYAVSLCLAGEAPEEAAVQIVAPEDLIRAFTSSDETSENVHQPPAEP